MWSLFSNVAARWAWHIVVVDVYDVHDTLISLLWCSCADMVIHAFLHHWSKLLIQATTLVMMVFARWQSHWTMYQTWFHWIWVVWQMSCVVGCWKRGGGNQIDDCPWAWSFLICVLLNCWRSWCVESVCTWRNWHPCTRISLICCIDVACHVGDVGVRALSAVLKNVSSLTSLDLSCLKDLILIWISNVWWPICWLLS